MPDVYLRVSAVNLGDSVYDTNDISTIRGGSFMLLDAVKGMAEAPSLEPLLEKISIGASEGIFKLKEDSGSNPHQVKEKARSFLSKAVGGREGSAFGGHATFVVDTLESDASDFQKIQEHLIAENRWRQLQQLTVSWDVNWQGGSAPCYHNGVRPGLNKMPIPGLARKQPVSASVGFRQGEGRRLRNEIYRRIITDGQDLPNFTDHLEALSTNPPEGISKNLDGKIAFIYVDGNKFGKIRQKHCKNETSLSAFDKAVQENFRARVLRRVVDTLGDEEDRSGYIIKNENKHLRLETLLWGGDEIEWIVPAWKGWEILRLFYETDPPPTFDQSSVPDFAGRTIPLTHAAGIVFCKHSAPILQIRRLARNLADLAKARLNRVPEERKEGDIFHYLALDSFDMVEGDVDHFLKRHYRPCDYRDLIMNGPEMTGFSANLSKLKADFPRNKLYDIIGALQCGQHVAPIFESALAFCPEERRADLSAAVEALVGSNPTRWFAVADLWDFA